MMWILIALVSYFLWGLVNIGDKYIITNKIKSPYVYLVLLTWSGILSIFLIPFVDFFVPDIKWLGWILLATISYFFGGLPYVKAVKMEDITRINVWWNLIPVFTLIIAWVAINERMTNIQLLAFVILLAGSIVASIHFNQKSISLSKALPWMIIATIAYSTYAVIIRHVTQEVPFLVAYIWNGIIVFFLSFSLFIVPKFRTDFKKDIKAMNKKVGGTIIAIAVFDELGIIFNIWALSLGPAALIFALEGSQTIFVFLLVVLISLFKPYVLKETLDKRNIILKLIAICIIIFGVFLLNLG